MTTLMTRRELAKLLNVSTRTIDRWRSAGLDLGEFHAHPRAVPRFDPAKVRQAIESSRFAKVRQKPSKPTTVPKKLCVTNDGMAQSDLEGHLTALAG